MTITDLVAAIAQRHTAGDSWPKAGKWVPQPLATASRLKPIMAYDAVLRRGVIWRSHAPGGSQEGEAQCGIDLRGPRLHVLVLGFDVGAISHSLNAFLSRAVCFLAAMAVRF